MHGTLDIAGFNSCHNSSALNDMSGGLSVPVAAGAPFGTMSVTKRRGTKRCGGTMKVVLHRHCRCWCMSPQQRLMCAAVRLRCLWWT